MEICALFFLENIFDDTLEEHLLKSKQTVQGNFALLLSTLRRERNDEINGYAECTWYQHIQLTILNLYFECHDRY